MKEPILLPALCLLVVLVSLGVAVWTVVGGQIGEQGVDALFLLAVCLVVAATFSFIPIQAIRQGLLKEWIVARRQRRSATAPPPEAGIAPPAPEAAAPRETSKTA